MSTLPRRRYSRDILVGLDELHSAGFVVLDVKPANVLISKHGDAVLSDFGLARALEDGATRLVCTACAAMVAVHWQRAQPLRQPLRVWVGAACST